jgi:uncharacterized protein
MKVMGTILNRGEADGPALVLTEPVSFWGAFDPRSGTIIDVHHPQCGATMAGHILLLPETRGSGGTPGGIAEAIRLRTGPLGIILVTPDINLAIGAAVAGALYGAHCPVVTVGAEDYAQLVRCRTVNIFQDGMIDAH